MANTNVIDRPTIEDLKETGPEGFLKEMVDLFASTVPGNLENLRQAYHSMDPEEVFQQAHRLKSSCNVIGALGMVELCQKIEILARSGINQEVIDSISRLEAVYIEVLEELRAIISGR